MLTQEDINKIKAALQYDMKRLDAKIAASHHDLKNDILNLDGRLTHIESKVDTLCSDVKEVKQDIGHIKENIADVQLETQAIHEIIKAENHEVEKRLDRIEDHLELPPHSS